MDAAELKAFPSQVFLDMRDSPNEGGGEVGLVGPGFSQEGGQGGGQGAQLQGPSEVQAVELRDVRPPPKARGVGRCS